METKEIEKLINVFIEEYYFDTKGEVRLALEHFARDLLKAENFETEDVKIATLKDALMGIENIHNKLDDLNGQEGNPCLYCKTDKHNCLGLTHTDSCVLVKIRNLIRYFEAKIKEYERK